MPARTIDHDAAIRSALEDVVRELCGSACRDAAKALNLFGDDAHMRVMIEFNAYRGFSFVVQATAYDCPLHGRFVERCDIYEQVRCGGDCESRGNAPNDEASVLVSFDGAASVAEALENVRREAGTWHQRVLAMTASDLDAAVTARKAEG